MDAKTVFDDFTCLHEPATALLMGPDGKFDTGGRFHPEVDAAGRIRVRQPGKDKGSATFRFYDAPVRPDR
jgi:hypothetical protein